MYDGFNVFESIIFNLNIFIAFEAPGIIPTKSLHVTHFLHLRIWDKSSKPMILAQ
jgi:hypothetical protein